MNPERLHSASLDSCRSYDVISSGPCHSIPLILFITCRVCMCVCDYKKHDVVTITYLNVYLRKDRWKIFATQSPPGILTEFSACAHEINCMLLLLITSSTARTEWDFQHFLQVFSCQQGSALISSNLTIHKNTSSVYKAPQKSVYWLEEIEKHLNTSHCWHSNQWSDSEAFSQIIWRLTTCFFTPGTREETPSTN